MCVYRPIHTLMHIVQVRLKYTKTHCELSKHLLTNENTLWVDLRLLTKIRNKRTFYTAAVTHVDCHNRIDAQQYLLNLIKIDSQYYGHVTGALLSMYNATYEQFFKHVKIVIYKFCIRSKYARIRFDTFSYGEAARRVLSAQKKISTIITIYKQ